MKRYFLHTLLVLMIVSVLTVSVFAHNSDPLAGGSPVTEIPDDDQPDRVNTETGENLYFEGTLKTSEQGIEMLKDMEGYVQKPTGDYQQYSIGYGCNTKYLKTYYEKLDISEEDLALVLDRTEPNYILKEEKAEALMMYVLQEIEEDLDKFLEKYKVELNQYQYDSLVSFTYNLGTAWMTADSRLGKVLLADEFTVNEFASAMGVYCHVTQNGEAKVLDLLVSRRIQEIKLFLYGAYELNDTDVKFCTLTYDGAGGDIETDIGFYQVGEPYQILFGVEPTEDTDSYFIGWYDEYGEKVTSSTVAEKSMAVTAGWSDSPDDPELSQEGPGYTSEGGPDVGETEYTGSHWTPVDITTVFSDMKPQDWHYEYVSELYSRKVIDGYPDRTFRPNGTVTTGEALKMILLAAGYETPEPVASHWARNFLNLALEEALIDRGDITDLDVPITRAMMAKIVVRSLKLSRKSDVQYFTDTDNVNAQILFEYQISDGYGDGTFRPDRTLSRAELSAVVCRMYDCQ